MAPGLSVALWLTVLSADPASVVEQALSLELHDERLWHLLLHYRPGALGPVSDVDDPTFFLAPDGKRDSAAELIATVRGLVAPVDDPETHVSCRFPARSAWLRQRLDLDADRLPACPRLTAWLEELRPGRLTFVFASAFLNSPPSMFGHTMLRVDPSERPDEVLISTILHYGGHPNTDNPVLYAIRGLTGGFWGRFSTMPYYLKVQEYTDLDRRDLWEYQLNLSPAQLRRLLLHAWELRNVQLEYFFIDENCSYQILTLLDVADPDLHLADQFGNVTLPTDTVRAIAMRPGLVRKRVYRPALTTVLTARHGLLTRAEVEQVESLVDASPPGFAALAALAPERRALVLETAHDYLKFRHPYAAGQALDPSRPEAATELAILRERSVIEATAPQPAIVTPAGPEEGHGSSRIGLGFGLDGSAGADGELFVDLQLRLAFHDLLDRAAGFVPDSEIVIGDLQVRLYPDRLAEAEGWRDGVALERFELMRITSIVPRQGWTVAPSYRVALGGGRVADLGCRGETCFAADLSGGPGFAVGTQLLGREVWYALAEVTLAAGPAFTPEYRIGGGGSAGLLWEPFAALRVQAEASYRLDFAGDVAAGEHLVELQLAANLALAQNLATRFALTWLRERAQGMVAFYYYYD